MKSDDVLRAIADSGGVAGVSGAPPTTLSHARPHHIILSVMDHFLHCVDLVGIEHVAFGSDTLYGDHVQLHTVFAHQFKAADMGGPAFKKVEYVDGLVKPTENFTIITRWMVQQGFSDAAIEAALGGNLIRVLDAVWV